MRAKINVAVNDAEMVNSMLLVTCLSEVVSNKLEIGVLNTMPAIGATIKSSISPKATEIIKLNVLLCIATAKLNAGQFRKVIIIVNNKMVGGGVTDWLDE